MTPARGQLADTTIREIHHGSRTTATINELSMTNVSGSDCWVRTYWNGVEDVYVELGPQERTRLYKGLVLDGTDSIKLQAQLPASINYKLNVSQ